MFGLHHLKRTLLDSKEDYKANPRVTKTKIRQQSIHKILSKTKQMKAN